jgi:hypothetical protein
MPSNGANGIEINNASAKVFAHNSGFDQNSNDGVLVSNGTFTADSSWASFNTVAGFETKDSAASYLTHVAATFNADGVYTTATMANVYWAYSNITGNTTDLNGPGASTTFLGGVPNQGSSLTGSQSAPTPYMQPLH